MDTNKVKLTKAWLAKVKPNGKLHFIWDEDQPGFGVQVTPAGKLSYVIRYRFGGAEKRKVIGKVAPSLTPEHLCRKSSGFRRGLRPQTITSDQ